MSFVKCVPYPVKQNALFRTNKTVSNVSYVRKIITIKTSAIDTGKPLLLLAHMHRIKQRKYQATQFDLNVGIKPEGKYLA